MITSIMFRSSRGTQSKPFNYIVQLSRHSTCETLQRIIIAERQYSPDENRSVGEAHEEARRQGN